MFSSKSFTVSGLASRLLIHFEFTFVYAVRKCSNSINKEIVVPITQPFASVVARRMKLESAIQE